ncbi:hypothetical protein EIP86_000203 [Pleurotus ostreatoroseus]|nr:hypothetical protein EIP86_000203 [Pleurotus ostreatoroseus]
MEAQTRHGQVSSTPARLLQLNEDVFKHIMDYISIKDACRLRLCSKQAAQVAALRALSTRTLRMSEGIRTHVEGILQRIDVGNTPEFACLVDLTLISTSLPNWRESTIAFAPVLLRLLQKAPGLQALTCADYEILLGSEPMLQRSISGLRSLQTLVLSSCPAGTSGWLLIRAELCEQGSLEHLVRLSISQLGLPDVDQSSVAQLVHLRTLTVQTLSGQLALLVHFAPNLTHLEVGSIDRADELPEMIPRRWRPLDVVMGRLCDLHGLLPLFRRPIAMRRIVLTDHVVEHGEHCVTDVLSATQLCCLEFRGQDYLPIHQVLPSMSQRLFYLEVCRPEGGHPWLVRNHVTF